jgi:hypothetical protein
MRTVFGGGLLLVGLGVSCGGQVARAPDVNPGAPFDPNCVVTGVARTGFSVRDPSDPERPSDDRVALYFGEGGTYDADGLDDRAEMLSDVREAVSLMNHDLRLLAAEVARR